MAKAPEYRPNYTPEQVASIVETEGLGYAVECYMDEAAIAPGPLRDAWRDARLAIGRIQELLPDVGSEDDDE